MQALHPDTLPIAWGSGYLNNWGGLLRDHRAVSIAIAQLLNISKPFPPAMLLYTRKGSYEMHACMQARKCTANGHPRYAKHVISATMRSHCALTRGYPAGSILTQGLYVCAGPADVTLGNVTCTPVPAPPPGRRAYPQLILD